MNNRYSIFILSLISLLLFSCQLSFGQGTNCASATPLSMNNITSTITLNGTPAAPVLTDCTTNAIIQESWFSMTASTAHSVVTFANMGTQTAYIYAYSGACGALTYLSCATVTQNNVNLVNFHTTSGQNYFIRIIQADAGGAVSGRVGAFPNTGDTAVVCIPDKIANSTGSADEKGIKTDNLMTLGCKSGGFFGTYAVGYAKFNTTNVPATSININDITFITTFNNGATAQGEIGITKMTNDALNPVTASANQIYQQYSFDDIPSTAFYAKIDPSPLISTSTYVYPLLPFATTNFSSRYTQGWWGVCVPVEWNSWYSIGEILSFYGWNSIYYPYIIVTYTPICTPPNITIQPNTNITQCAGSDVNYTITATGKIPLTYIWRKDGNPINGATTSTLTLNNTTPADNGTYTCIITNSCPGGSVTSANAILTIYDQTKVDSIHKADEDCGKTNGFIKIFTSKGNGTFTYLWNTNQTTDSIGGLPAASYKVTVNSGPCPALDTTIIVSNIGGPKVTVDSTDEHCGNADGTVTAHATDGTGNYTYLWDTPNKDTTMKVSNLKAGVYTVIVNDGKCPAVASIVVKNVPGVRIDSIINFNNETCSLSNATATIVASVGIRPYTYLWSSDIQDTIQQDSILNNVKAGTYYIVLTDKSGCTIKDTLTFTDTPPPVISIKNHKDELCQRSDGYIVISVTGGKTPYTYVWNNNPVLNTDSIFNLKQGTYTVTVTDNNNCPAGITDSIKNTAPFSVKVITTDGHCNKNDAAATVIITGNITNYTFKWSADSLINNDTINNLQPGNQYVIVSDTSCSLTNNFIITNFPGPKADFTHNPENVKASDGTCNLFDLSQGSVKWLWKLEGQKISDLANPTVNLTKTGDNYITLIVTDAYGCNDSISKIIVVKEDFTFYIPNSFSPNYNYKNDTLRPFGTFDQIKSYEMRIFNRWGNQVFISNDIKIGWNGTYNGMPSQPDIYLYVINLLPNTGRMRIYNGLINLIR